jgi:hypothetical protein
MTRLLSLILLVSLVACGDARTDAPGAGDHSAHTHEAPRGGALVVLREEGAHVELLVDRATGHLSLIVLGAHAAKPIRIAQPAISLIVDVAGASQPVELPAVASELTGETVGDTSEFAADIDALKGAGTFTGQIASVTVRGETYTDLAFTYP